MTDDLELQGPTVTLFGDRDALDTALSDELGRRGRSTHAVTIPVGWLSSTTHAVIRLDSTAGERALEDLAIRDLPATHVIAVCETPADDATSARLDQLCRQCGEHHEVSLIWHAPFEAALDVAVPVPATLTVPAELAATIADEIAEQWAHASVPSFASHVFAPRAS